MPSTRHRDPPASIDYAGIYPRKRIAGRIEDGENPIKVLREAIRDADQALHERFLSGACIRDLVRGRAWLIDQVLRMCWDQHQWPASATIALIAVGGYGRGELHPHSDIDLLILVDNDAAEDWRDAVEAFLTLLWDINLTVGHSVRTLDECVKLAADDITVATNLMESRLLAGSPDLVTRMQDATGPEQIWPTKAFFAAKRDEQVQRHHKYNDTEYNLEPNIKGAPGGLRDIQTIGWVAKRHFSAQSFSDLVELGFINEFEYATLQACQELLWRLRYALHMLNDRAEDRLLFDHQRAIAEMFGYNDTSESLAVEKLMQEYYRAVQQVSQVNEVLLQHFDEAILRAGETEEINPVNERFQARNGYLETIHDEVFTENPFALIEVFVLLARQPELQGVRASTVRLIRDHRHLVTETFRMDPLCTSLFMELMRCRETVARELQRMQRYGILGVYLPEFGRITGQMQHDLFHIYTVDAHTLLVVRNMQEFSSPEARERFPTAAASLRQLPRVELLFLAGLFHDIAKGRGGDHSELGSADAIAFCERHGLGRWDTALVAWLVENHLVMSTTAQRKDVSDPDVVRDFALLVGDQVRLDYLYTLTIADICATNPALWNGWRATLLRQLYVETKRTLRRGLENPVNRQDWIDETQEQALALLAARGVDGEAVQRFWSHLGDEYFLQDSPNDIAWHTEAILAHGDSPEPLVLVQETTAHESEGGTQIFVYTRDQANLFAVTAAALDKLNLNIHDARIITSESNFSLDTYIVLEDDGRPIGNDPARVADIREALREALRNPEEYPHLVTRHTPRQLRHFPVPTSVTISTDPRSRVTALEVITPDRPGLLARVGRIFLDFGVSLQMAKISTLGERVEDTFYICDANGEPLSDPDLCEHLRDRIIEGLDAQVQAEQK